MRRRPGLLLVVAVVLVGVLAVGGWVRANAREATPAAAGDGFVGTWRVSLVGEGARRPREPFPATFTLGRDGTLVQAQPAWESLGAEPSLAFSTFLSAGLGAWEATGERSAAFTFDILHVVGQYDREVHRGTMRGTLELSADGQALGGRWATRGVDPRGNEIPGNNGTLEGTRMAIAPLEATPAAGTPTT